VKFQKNSNFFENIESKSHMTERKKKWKRKGADSPLGSNNLNEAEEENDSNGLTNGNGKSPLKQLDPTNSSSPSAHSNSKSSKQEGEAKETAENGHISHEIMETVLQSILHLEANHDPMEILMKELEMSIYRSLLSII